MCLLKYVTGWKLCSGNQNTKSSNLHRQKQMALVSWMLNLKVSLCVAGFLPESVSWHGYIAQWLEQLTADQQVPGSNPGVPFPVFLVSCRYMLSA